MDIPIPAVRNALWRRPEVLKLLIVALLAEIGYAALNLSTMPVYLQEDRKFGTAVIGLVLTAFLLCEAAFKTPMGLLADRFGSKRFMVIGPLISVGTALLSLAIPYLFFRNEPAGPLEVIIFVVLRCLDGIGIAMLWPAAFAQMNAAVADEERQQAMSLLNGCYMVGVALAFPVGGIANDLSGTHWARLVLAAFLFGAVALTAYRSIPARATAAHHEEAEEGLGVVLASLKQIPEYLLLSVIVYAGIGFPALVFKLFPIQEFGFSETKVGMLILPGALALAAGAVPMAKLGERLGRVRAVHVGLLVSAVGMGVIASGAILPFMRQPFLLSLAGLPVGIGFLLAIPAWMASVSDIDPKRRGSNLGAVMTAQGLGAIVGAPLGATLYEKLQPVGEALGLGKSFGHYAPFVGCAACLTLAYVISLRVLRPTTQWEAPLGDAVEATAAQTSTSGIPGIDTAVVQIDAGSDLEAR